MNGRFKNIWFWIGLVNVVFLTTGINPSSLTSWSIFFSDLTSIATNPFMLFSTFTAILSVFIDPTTEGITDSVKEKSDMNGNNDK